MITQAQRTARAALDAARPAVARLDSGRGGEDVAADLIEAWDAVEGALRALVGSTVLSGQALIREARQRQAINFEQANSLAEFQAARDRLQDTSYHATDADINSARTAFLKLDSALTGESGTEPVRGAAVAPAPAVPESAAPAAIATTTRSRPAWLIPAAVGFAVVVVGGIVFGIMRSRGSNDSLQQGINAYRLGQREAAVNAFNRAVREDPADPTPHVYLARMDREVGNFTLATQELQLAIKADTSFEPALREMGANMLAQNNYQLAVRFYVRAAEADPNDKTALGFLGCSLTRLGRSAEAAKFFTRAGPGPWTNCAAAAPNQLPPQPGALTAHP